MRGRATGRLLLAILALALFVAPLSLEGQRHSRRDREFDRRPRVHLDLDFVVGQPLGEFNQFVDTGFGGEIAGIFALDRRGFINLRVDGGFVIYGLDSERACFSQTVGCRVTLDVTTSNHILYGGIGPEIHLADGPVRPYLNGLFGFSYFQTTSSVSGDLDHQPFARSENLGDGTLSFRGGGGLQFQVSGGRNPVSIDLGARYHHNGLATYLKPGGIVDNPDGSIDIFPIRSEANLMTYSLGVRIGLGGGRGGGY